MVPAEAQVFERVTDELPATRLESDEKRVGLHAPIENAVAARSASTPLSFLFSS
jgi:hypothetical protein